MRDNSCSPGKHALINKRGARSRAINRAVPIENWERVQNIFLAVADLPRSEQEPSLRKACAGDNDLYLEVRSLLACDGDNAEGVDAVIKEEAYDLLDVQPLLGKRLGAYRVVREIGRGGMGTVYLAVRDDDEFKKQVAIKLVRRGLDTADVLLRFRHERQILANLDHPYIARLLDGGTTPDGRPYFAMEYVEGMPVGDYCSGQALDVNARCRLFLKVCEAVSHAHRNLVVHRDLKPSNILVTADGSPKLLDFGVAKLLSPDPDGVRMNTVSHARPLTPEYSSPEQILGRAVDTTTDVYSLGAVLFELLTGEQAQPLASNPEDMERVICRTEVRAPSLAVHRGANPSAALEKELKRDLDNIVLMAMRKDPARRYQSVDQFAGDIRNYLEGRPVLARQDSFTYRFGKFLRRNRVGVAAGVMIVASLAGGLAFSLAAQHRAERRFNDVRSLAGSFLEVHDEISKLPGSTKARGLVLRKALVYLDSLAKDAAGDASLQIDLARAYLKVGSLQGSGLADVNKSVASYRKAVEIARALAAAEPKDVRRQLLLVKALYGLGQQESRMGNTESARRSLEEGRRIVEGLESEDSEALELAATGSSLLGSLARAEGEFTSAVTELRRAARLVTRWRQAYPGERADYEFSVTNYLLSIVLQETGELEESRRAINDAWATTGTLVARHPENAVYSQQADVELWTRAVHAGDPRFVNAGDFPTALALFRKVAEQRRRSLEADPANARAQAEVFGANLGVAVVTAEISPDKGLPLLEESLAQSKALPSDTLETGLVHHTLAGVYRSSGLAAARLRRWSLASTYLSEALTIQESLAAAKPSFFNRLNHAVVLREIGWVEAEAGNLAVAEQRYRQALAELAKLEEGHRQELWWVWKTTEVLEGLGSVRQDADRTEAFELYRKSLATWDRWRSEGGKESVFFRVRRDRAARLVDAQTSY
jgi:serine/threonine protein kinase